MWPLKTTKQGAFYCPKCGNSRNYRNVYGNNGTDYLSDSCSSCGDQTMYYPKPFINELFNKKCRSCGKFKKNDWHYCMHCGNVM